MRDAIQVKFQYGDKAEFSPFSGKWVPVTINSSALQWVDSEKVSGYVYLVVGEGQPHLAHSDHLRRVEQWEPCPGVHRYQHALDCGMGGIGPWERLVEANKS